MGEVDVRVAFSLLILFLSLFFSLVFAVTDLLFFSEYILRGGDQIPGDPLWRGVWAETLLILYHRTGSHSPTPHSFSLCALLLFKCFQ